MKIKKLFLKLQGIFFVVICLQHSQYANKDSDSYKDYAIWAEPGNETSGKKTDLEERF